ncbi:MAG: hypothetical protein CHACPFDD_03809 [Phycisphaerae bacterium]|nr:hypothetical protein [Phycisphaerae bacterium]
MFYMRRTPFCFLLALSGAVAAGGCNNGQSQPEVRVRETQSPPPTSAPATSARSAPATAPAPREPLHEPRFPKPELPEYITLLVPTPAPRKTDVRVNVVPPARLEIETENVRRLRIDRRKLPFPPGRSVALQIDGQAFELTSRSGSVDFERSATGEWKAIEPKP